MVGVILGEIWDLWQGLCYVRFVVYGMGYARWDLGFMAGVMLGEIWGLWQGFARWDLGLWQGYVRWDLGFKAGVMLGEIQDLWQGLC